MPANGAAPQEKKIKFQIEIEFYFHAGWQAVVQEIMECSGAKAKRNAIGL